MITKKAFTLIELMIAITIVVILTMATYAPYNYYQNKAKLKVTTREISQILYEWRNMAVNWAVGESHNISIWVYFETSALEKNKVKIFSYPFDIINNDIKYEEWPNVKLLKTLKLQKWIEINDIEGYNNMLFVFDAITWELNYHNWENWNRVLINSPKPDIVSIEFSYKNSSSENLRRSIKYFTSTNIIDY